MKAECEHCGVEFTGFAAEEMLRDHKRAEHSTWAL